MVFPSAARPESDEGFVRSDHLYSKLGFPLFFRSTRTRETDSFGTIDLRRSQCWSSDFLENDRSRLAGAPFFSFFPVVGVGAAPGTSGAAGPGWASFAAGAWGSWSASYTAFGLAKKLRAWGDVAIPHRDQTAIAAITGIAAVLALATRATVSWPSRVAFSGA